MSHCEIVLEMLSIPNAHSDARVATLLCPGVVSE
jgi:hypothetical protein